MSLTPELRSSTWSDLTTPWDIIIIGGGITGAGILREAARLGLRVLLLEAKDFASGTSSRSSKLVHGGFRYLKNGQIKVTFESVRERERLLREGRGLINQLGFLMASYQEDAIPRWVFGLGLIAYDMLAFKWGHRYYDAYDLRELCPSLKEAGLQGGYRFFDAQTDDARLVLRLVQEGVQDGGAALNYARVTHLLRAQDGRVCGVGVVDGSGGPARTAEVQAKVVINATGAWADDLRGMVGARGRLRRLRGSHLVFSAERLPLTRAVNLWHPRDGRPVFAFPWEGITLLGTTDVDHDQPLDAEPAISQAEVDYLLSAVQHLFPDRELAEADIQGTFAGVRPVIDTGKKDPSKESREHVLWQEKGLLTTAGGKLTTFRLMAIDALRAAAASLPGLERRSRGLARQQRVLDELPAELPAPSLKWPARLRLSGRYGAAAAGLVAMAGPGEMERIPGSNSLWAELRWAARQEGVVHLDDLLLRRVRLGIVLPRGGLDEIERIRAAVQPELGWDDARWQAEQSAYTDLWKKCYHLPVG